MTACSASSGLGSARPAATCLGSLLGLLLCGIVPALADDTASIIQPVSLQLFVNVTGDSWGDVSGDAMHIDIAGIPLVLGSGQSFDDAGTGMTAGVDGGYRFPLSSRLTFEGHTIVSRTSYLSNVLFGPANVTSQGAFRYTDGSLSLALEPMLGASLVDTVVDQKNYAVTGQVSKALLAGWTLAARSSYAEHDFDYDADDNNTAEGSFGFSYEFQQGTRHPKIDVTYLFRREMAEDNDAANTLRGPTVTATLPLLEQFNIGANYCYGETTINEFVDNSYDRREEQSHRLGVTADWHIDGKAASSLDLKAGYDYIRNASDEEGLLEEAHAATVSMALHF